MRGFSGVPSSVLVTVIPSVIVLSFMLPLITAVVCKGCVVIFSVILVAPSAPVSSESNYFVFVIVPTHRVGVTDVIVSALAVATFVGSPEFASVALSIVVVISAIDHR